MQNITPSRTLLVGSAVAMGAVIGVSLVRLARASLRAKPGVDGWLGQVKHCPPEAVAQWENEGGACHLVAHVPASSGPRC